MAANLEYISTRGNDGGYDLTNAILNGMGSDGGLLVPEKLPQVSIHTINLLRYMAYPQRAFTILNRFHPIGNTEGLAEDIEGAYGDNFDNPNIAPVSKLKPNQYLQELYHGPTAAFKDMALQYMPLIFSRAVDFDSFQREERGKRPLHYVILAATSGDTGKAALEGYKDVLGCSIIAFYPYGLVSKLQELQMVTQEGSNVSVQAMDGNFDNIRAAVTETFADREFEKRLRNSNVTLTSANSINWGRIMPQIAYHFSAYADLVNQGVIAIGDKVDISVPTGNFGNILSAFYARCMGLPLGKFICASNENNVLTEFLRTGVYDLTTRPELIKTHSPSMDILVSSNIERLLYEVTGNPVKVSAWMKELKQEHRFFVDPDTTAVLKELFFADWVSNTDTLTNIRSVAEETGVVMDPHTSVAQTVAERWLDQSSNPRPIIIDSTAHWAKFAGDVCLALFESENTPADEFEAIKRIEDAYGVSAPESISSLISKTIRHTGRSEANASSVKSSVLAYLGI